MTPIDILEQSQWVHSWLPSTCTIIDRSEVCYFVSQSSPSRNMIVRFRPTKDRIGAVVDEISRAYQSKSCTFWFYPHRHGEDVQYHLRRVGFSPHTLHHMCVKKISDHISPPIENIGVRLVETFEDAKELFVVQARAFGNAQDNSDEEIRSFLEKSTGENPICRYFLAFDSVTGESIAQGGLGLFTSLKFGLFFAGGTISEHRKKGAYTALVSARIAYAKSLGYQTVGLFAKENTSAPIVAKHGFYRCGDMIYWKRAPV